MVRVCARCAQNIKVQKLPRRTSRTVGRSCPDHKRGAHGKCDNCNKSRQSCAGVPRALRRQYDDLILAHEAWYVAPDDNDAQETQDLADAQQAFNSAYAHITHGKEVQTDEKMERRQRFESNVLEALQDIANSLRSLNAKTPAPPSQGGSRGGTRSGGQGGASGGAQGGANTGGFEYAEDYDEF